MIADVGWILDGPASTCLFGDGDPFDRLTDGTVILNAGKSSAFSEEETEIIGKPEKAIPGLPLLRGDLRLVGVVSSSILMTGSPGDGGFCGVIGSMIEGGPDDTELSITILGGREDDGVVVNGEAVRGV
jgi:hypothetical protein